MPKSITFELERETKNTLRFAEVADAGQPPVIGTLYVAKWALPDGAKKLNVTIDVAE